jgi:hypothetical protein
MSAHMILFKIITPIILFVLYILLTAVLLKRIKNNYYNLWLNLEGNEENADTFKKTFRFLKFIFFGEYKELNDRVISILCLFIKYIFIIYLALFVYLLIFGMTD